MEDVNRTWRCSVEEPSGVWGAECGESWLRNWGDLLGSLSTFSVTDPISHHLAKWEEKPDGGVGDAHSSGDGWDNITQSERRGVTLFERPKRVRGANASNG